MSNSDYAISNGKIELSVPKAKGNNLLPFVIVSVYFIADLFLPVIQYLSSVYVMIFATLVIVYIVFLGKNHRKTLKLFVPFLPLVLILLINDFIRIDGDLKSIIIVLYSRAKFILPVIICCYILVNNYLKSARIILITSVIFIILTSLTSIYWLSIDPMASKVLATGGIDESQLMMYYKNNVGGFHFTYLIPIIMPMLIASLKDRRTSPIISTTVLLIPVYLVYKTQYAIALFLLIISLSSVFFANKYSFKKFTALAAAMALLLIFARPFVGQAFYFIADQSPGYMVSERFNAMGDALRGIGSDNDAYVGRVDKYQLDVDAFLSSPLIGTIASGGRSGGHSFILDNLALYGIVGLVGLVLFYRQIYVYFYKPFKNAPYYGFMLWSFGTGILLAVLNPTPSLAAIGLLVPLAAFVMQYEKNVGLSKEKVAWKLRPKLFING